VVCTDHRPSCRIAWIIPALSTPSIGGALSS